MQRLRQTVFTAVAVLSSLGITWAAENAPSENRPEPPGLGDPGQLQSVEIETGRLRDGKFELSGRDAYQQLVVTGVYSSGQRRDLTREVAYTVSPEGILEVDATGFITPVQEGDASVHVQTSSGLAADVAVRVGNIASDIPVNFPNQVVPIFTKYGCNGGGCHGKSGGQNGFRLSLLGFEPPEDFEYLVKEGRGRRLFFASPEKSLLLMKATAELPHGGGHRIDLGSPSYRLLRRWIEQGAPYGNPEDPTVTRIEIFPQERLMGRKAQQQLIAIAHYTDGSTEDVTRMTQFDSNDSEMAEVSAKGLVTTAQLTGSVAVMARYQGHVGVFRATVPLGIAIDQLPPSQNYVDEVVFTKLQNLGLPPSTNCDDATFLRRLTIDLAGRLPTLQETETFLADNNPQKRQQLVEHLLASTDYADFFANKWSAILRNKRRRNEDRRATYAFHAWIRDSFLHNKPYDEFVREIVAATGQADLNPPVAWYREVNDQAAQVEDTAQLFLGLRIQCARCHHHPFEKWSQEDYYGFAAFFSQVGRKKGTQPGLDRVYHRPGAAQAQNPKTGKGVKPTGLGSPALEISPVEDPRQALADWLSQPDNPFFAKALVNRYWKHFFGRGLVDPEDDMRVTNPASNPELLDALAADFVAHHYDIKHLIRTICNSQTYQLSAEPNDWNVDDKQNFSRYYPKRLNAEVLLDAINQVTATSTNFGGIPVGTRATQLPDNGFNSYFLTVFGRPESSSACECERSSEANLAQSLHLLNSAEIQGKLTAGDGRAALLASDAQRQHQEKIRELYLLSFSREPLEEELSIALAYIEKTGDAKRAFEDIVWALINTKEFLFNH
jgi:hypothetical protein